ncbi:MAG: SAM-dependent chlorinase/fluorinase [Ktedonobacteraceae bacterium]
MFQSISSASGATIALLTDFGLADGYVGVMKGVIAGIAPGVALIDVTHDIKPHDIAAAAWVLATSYRYFPEQTIFVCVVDPGVGSQRQPLAMRAGNWYFVGPNNGLFSYVLQEQPVHETVVLTNPAYHLSQVSATFQGRDIFSPVAAHLARAVPLTALGPAIETSALLQLPTSGPRVQEGQISAQVVHIDRFGNIVTNIALHMLPDLFAYPEVQLVFARSGTIVSARRRFFAETTGLPQQDKQPFIYVDSSGYIGVALQNGNAASTLGVTVGESVSTA